MQDFTHGSQLGKVFISLHLLGTVGMASWYKNLLVCEGLRRKSASVQGEQTQPNLSHSQSNVFTFFEPTLDAIGLCEVITDPTCKHVLPTANKKERVGHRK